MQRRCFNLFVPVCREPVFDHACERTLRDRDERTQRCGCAVPIFLFPCVASPYLTTLAHTRRETNQRMHVVSRNIPFVYVRMCNCKLLFSVSNVFVLHWRKQCKSKCFETKSSNASWYEFVMSSHLGFGVLSEMAGGRSHHTHAHTHTNIHQIPFLPPQTPPSVPGRAAALCQSLVVL